MTAVRHPPGEKPHRLEGFVTSLRELEDRVELQVTLRNPDDRALHYISDVRAMIFDPTTGHLRVRLSEQGLEMAPPGTMIEPRFRVLDPQSEASLTIRLPKTIVKLGPPSPTGEVTFEEHAIADASVINLEIGWADTPYYQDTREKARDMNPIEAWEQDRLQVVHERRSESA